MPRNTWLLAAGILSSLAALLHIACIVGGADWYRFVGAGEPIARAAERGEWWPHLLTLAIAAILSIWAAYAFAGAGVGRRLPLMRTALVLISLIYLARGLMILNPAAFTEPGGSVTFMIWSSLIVLVYGLTYAVGTWRAWPHLSNRSKSA